MEFDRFDVTLCGWQHVKIQLVTNHPSCGVVVQLQLFDDCDSVGVSGRARVSGVQQTAAFKVEVKVNQTWLSVALCPQKPWGLLGTGAQDDHLDFHTAPELSMRHVLNVPFMPLATQSVNQSVGQGSMPFSVSRDKLNTTIIKNSRHRHNNHYKK